MDLERTRDAVLTVAAGMFARDGFAGTPMAEVARAAGMGVGTLYKYFPSKEALFRAMVDRFFEGLLAAADQALAAPAPNLEAALSAYARAALSAAARDPDSCLAAARETLGSRVALKTASGPALWARIQEHRAQVAELFHRHGTRPGLDPLDAAVFFLGTLWAFAEYDLNRGAPEAVAGRADPVVALVLRGVEGRP